VARFRPTPYVSMYVCTIRLKITESSISSQEQDIAAVNDDSVQQRLKLDSVRQQTVGARKALCLLRDEYDSACEDMKLLLEAIDQRRLLLVSLDAQLQSDITQRRCEIEVQCKRVHHRIDQS